MTRQHDQIRSTVRDQYAKIAEAVPKAQGCAPACCGGGDLNPVDSELLGYSAEELAALPEGANMGLGCGNPVAIAALKEGERVLDLGSGGGIDCLLAAKRVGPKGQVIGVDMTPTMVEKARQNVRDVGADNVSIRLGEIEHLPVADASVDVILSNCVINLSPDKKSVFREALRVLAPGGRLSISDVVATAALPDELRDKAEALTGCVSGAVPAADIQALLEEVGFEKVSIAVSEASRAFIKDWFPGSGAENYVASATISAIKPGGACCAPSCCDGEADEAAG